MNLLESESHSEKVLYSAYSTILYSTVQYSRKLRVQYNNCEYRRVKVVDTETLDCQDILNKGLAQLNGRYSRLAYLSGVK